jgi:hypothetical protein
MVYRGLIKLSPQQFRAAVECLQFEVLKVSAVAVSHMNGNDFASALERAIARSEPVRRLPAPIIDAEPVVDEPVVTPEEMKRPFVRPYRRF